MSAGGKDDPACSNYAGCTEACDTVPDETEPLEAQQLVPAADALEAVADALRAETAGVAGNSLGEKGSEVVFSEKTARTLTKTLPREFFQVIFSLAGCFLLSRLFLFWALI